MGLEMQARKAVTKEVAARYRRAGKKEKVRILDEFCKTTGYARKYAITVLRNYGKESVVRIDGKMVRIVGGTAKKRKHTGRPKASCAISRKIRESHAARSATILTVGRSENGSGWSSEQMIPKS